MNVIQVRENVTDILALNQAIREAETRLDELSELDFQDAMTPELDREYEALAYRIGELRADRERARQLLKEQGAEDNPKTRAHIAAVLFEAREIDGVPAYAKGSMELVDAAIERPNIRYGFPRELKHHVR